PLIVAVCLILAMQPVSQSVQYADNLIVCGVAFEVVEKPKDGSSHAPDRAELLKSRCGFEEDVARNRTVSILWSVVNRIPDCPYRPAKGIFRAHFVQKPTIERHEVPECAISILRVLDIGEVAGDEPQSHFIPLSAVGHERHKQRPGIIIQAVPLMVVGNAVNRMLADARIVRESHNVIQSERWHHTCLKELRFIGLHLRLLAGLQQELVIYAAD